MKKTYKKPTIYFENFILNQTIAADCGKNLDWGMANSGTIEQCGWNIEGVEIFASPTACDFVMEDGMMDGACYDNPSGGYNIFSS